MALYEYRRYDAMPGRLPDLHSRFHDVTLSAFDRHGIDPVGFWDTVVGGSNELHYLLRWRDMADRESRWASFLADQEWQAARASTEQNGPIVAKVYNQLWQPTPYSSLK